MHRESQADASVDVTDANWRNCVARGGGADLSAQPHYRVRVARDAL